MKKFDTKNPKILELRCKMFEGCDDLSDYELQLISNKYHKIINRYQVFLANIQYRQLVEKFGEIKN